MRNLLLAGLLAASSVFAAPVFTIIPSLGPDFATSSQFDAWAANVIQGMRFGAPQGSGAATYNQLANGANLTGSEFIETGSGGFESWLGLAPGAFSNEYGTALYFGLKLVDSNGQATISLADLQSEEIFLGQYQGIFSMAGTGYRPAAMGIDANDNWLLAGEDATTLVKELYFVGVGFVQPLDTSIPGTPQDQIDGTRMQVNALSDRTTQVCYSLGKDFTECGSVNIAGDPSAVPEPGTMALLGLGLAGVAYFRRRSA